MKMISMTCWLLLGLLLLVSACTSGLRLKNGTYQFSINDPAIMDTDSKRVTVSVVDSNVTITNSDFESVFSGKITGNKLVLKSEDGDISVSMDGELISDNRVEGNIVQLNQDGESITSPFILEGVVE